MKKFISSVLMLSILMQCPIRLTPNAQAALSEQDRSLYTQRNALANPGFEASTAAWTKSGGTLTAVTTGVGTGSASGSWASSAAGQTLASAYQTVTPGDGFSGQNGVVSCRLKCATGTCTHTLSAFDGTNPIGDVKVIQSSTSGYARTSANFIYPLSGTVRTQFKSISATEPGLRVDDCYQGLAEGFNLTQATGLAGEPVRSDLVWTFPTAAMGTVIQNIQTRRVGDTLHVSGMYQMGTVTAGVDFHWLGLPAPLQIDTTKVISPNSRSLVGFAFSNNQGTGNLGGSTRPVFVDPSAPGRVYVGLGSDTTGFKRTIVATEMGSSGESYSVNFTVPITGWAAQVNGLNYLSDSSSVYLQYTGNSGQSITADVTNIPFSNKVTDINSAWNGSTFTAPMSAWYNVSGSILWSATTSARLYLTVNGSELYTLNSNVAIQVPAFSGGTYLNKGDILSIRSDTSGTIVNNSFAHTIAISNSSSTANIPSFIGSVTSQTSGQERIERVRLSTVCSGGTCAIADKTPGISSVTYVAVGRYTVSFSSGTFAGAPTCVPAENQSTYQIVSVYSPSASQVTVSTITAPTNAYADGQFGLICMGPR